MQTRKHSTLLLCLILVAGTAFTQTKRTLNHRDYDGWRTIGTPTLSRDGKFLAYGLFPEEGDGEVVVRNLTTNQEWREKAGERPQPAAAEPGAEEGPPVQRGVTISFTADGKWVIFSTFPNRADVEQAKKDKKRPDEMPKGGMVIMSLSDGPEGGKTARIANVKNFQVPSVGSGYFAYLKEATPAASDGRTEGSTADSEEEDQRGGRGGAGAGAGGRGRTTYGTDLILRNTSDGAERTFTDVSEYLLTRDAATLAYAVSSRKPETNGVYALPTNGTDARVLLAGKGKYSKITFDPKGYFVFVSNHDDADSKQPKWKLYGWDRRQPAAPAELVTASTPGLHAGYALSDRGTLRFTRDGSRLLLGVAPPHEDTAESEAPAGPTAPSASDDKVHADLWHWKDDHIQPIQKIRAAQDRNRTYVAVLDLATKKLVQLSTPEISTVTPSEQATWAFGVDDRAYRIMSDYDSGYGDLYLVDGTTGASKKLIGKNRGRPQWSPDGRFGIIFDGKDWNSISVPDGKMTNLTAKLGVAFWNEENDTPEVPPAYGAGGFTSDGKWALLYDDYDVWQVAPDGSSAKNLTAGLGRREHLRLRAMNFPSEDEDGGVDRGFDPTQPILLRAENVDTRDTGYYRVSFGGTPERLMMAARNFGAVAAGGFGRGGGGAGGTLLKARKANVVVVSASTFAEFPNLHVTELSFKELRKVTDANPQQSQLLWGTSEMIHFKNSDGVALEGALYKPENFDPKKKYPMLVYIYERLSQGLNNFVNPAPGHSINISYYVSNGYLVLTPDIVYTTGYPGQSALKCVLPAIQSQVDRGFVDEKAIGIQGHSWGGYQIAYMVTQTTRFRAAEAGAPVSDMISAYDGIRWGTGLPRQFQYEHTQSRIGGSIWEFPERFIQNSPIFQADRVQTPLMILQNDADDAVPWYQGIEYYLALRRLNKEVYMFVYNGEPHHINRRPNQKDYTVRMQQFFDHYLKGAPEPDWMKNGIPYLDRDQEKERFNQAVADH
jgi:dipeptidyl aminopeptidase/acylaminoacyl peptidase